MKTYDWIIVGGGISGISLSEILSRDDKDILLIDQNKKLAQETSGQFHEWFHSGALYSLGTLNPDTLCYILGSTDDLLKYYSNFERMNLRGTENGLKIGKSGWFNNEYIHYHFRNRFLNPIWTANVSITTNIINMINGHDFLRRRIGSLFNSKNLLEYASFSSFLPKNIGSKYTKVRSPDFSMNSFEILADILTQSLKRGVELSLNSKVVGYKKLDDVVIVELASGEIIRTKKLVVCAPEASQTLFDFPISTTYAPMVVLQDVNQDLDNFVRLDYYQKNCVNYIKKEGGRGLAGGISFKNINDAEKYIQHIINEQRLLHSNVKVARTYMGIKNEQSLPGQNRNYLFHIHNINDDVFSVVLGKFTSAFSMAPEFYRRIYNKNPVSDISIHETNNESKEYIAAREWSL